MIPTKKFSAKHTSDVNCSQLILGNRCRNSKLPSVGVRSKGFEIACSFPRYNIKGTSHDNGTINNKKTLRLILYTSTVELFYLFLGIQGDEEYRNAVEYLAMLSLVGTQFEKEMIRDEKKAEAAYSGWLHWTDK
jgi:hypothetical protein